MTKTLKNAKDMDVIRWIASNDNDKLSVVCRVLLLVVDAMNGMGAKPTNVVKAKRARLTLQDRAEIVASVEPPARIMKQFNISFSALRMIKSGTGTYGPSGGSKENWLIYKGRHAAACVSLYGADGSHHRRTPYTHVESLEDILTSSEAPSVLVNRHRCSMSHIRSVKRGRGHYRQKGGSERLWLDYYRLHQEEIERFLRR